MEKWDVKFDDVQGGLQHFYIVKLNLFQHFTGSF